LRIFGYKIYTKIYSGSLLIYPYLQPKVGEKSELLLLKSSVVRLFFKFPIAQELVYIRVNLYS